MRFSIRIPQLYHDRYIDIVQEIVNQTAISFSSEDVNQRKNGRLCIANIGNVLPIIGNKPSYVDVIINYEPLDPEKWPIESRSAVKDFNKWCLERLIPLLAN